MNFGSRRVTTAGFDGYVLAVGKSDMLCVSFSPKVNSRCRLSLIFYSGEEGPYSEDELGRVFDEQPGLRDFAFYKAAELLARLKSLKPVPRVVDGLTWMTSVNATLIQGARTKRYSR